MAINTIFGFMNQQAVLQSGRFGNLATTPTASIPGVSPQLLNNLTQAPGVSITQTGATPTSATSPTTATISNGLVGSPSLTNPTASLSQSQSDYRLRLAHLQGYQNKYPGIMAPLDATQGLMFPYTPTVAISQDVDYASLQMTHSNTDYYSFSRSPNTTINVTAKFSVQNQTEGKYVAAALMFLKSVSKMNFGQNDANKGLPPPILTLNGYGTYNFNMVRVFLKNHSYSFDESMDLVRVTVGSGFMMLPPLFTVTLTLTAQQTPRAMRQDFTLDSYRDGSLLAKGGYI